MRQPLLVICLTVLLFAFYLQVRQRDCECKDGGNLVKTTTLVVGAESDLGTVTVKECIRKGGSVIMACENIRICERTKDLVSSWAKEQSITINTKLTMMELKLYDLSTVRKLIIELKEAGQKLDHVIYTSGTFVAPYQLSADGNEFHMAVNYFTPFLLTELLISKLDKELQPKKLVFHVTSSFKFINLHTSKLQVTYNDYNRFKAYAQSQMALVVYATQLGHRMKWRNVETYLVDSGYINDQTSMDWVSTFMEKAVMKIAHLLMHSPGSAVKNTFCALLSNKWEASSLYASCKRQQIQDYVDNTQLARQLYEATSHAVNLEWVKGQLTKAEQIKVLKETELKSSTTEQVQEPIKTVQQTPDSGTPQASGQPSTTPPPPTVAPKQVTPTPPTIPASTKPQETQEQPPVAEQAKTPPPPSAAKVSVPPTPQPPPPSPPPSAVQPPVPPVPPSQPPETPQAEKVPVSQTPPPPPPPQVEKVPVSQTLPPPPPPPPAATPSVPQTPPSPPTQPQTPPPAPPTAAQVPVPQPPPPSPPPAVQPPVPPTPSSTPPSPPPPQPSVAKPVVPQTPPSTPPPPAPPTAAQVPVPQPPPPPPQPAVQPQVPPTPPSTPSPSPPPHSEKVPVTQTPPPSSPPTPQPPAAGPVVPQTPPSPPPPPPPQPPAPPTVAQVPVPKPPPPAVQPSVPPTPSSTPPPASPTAAQVPVPQPSPPPPPTPPTPPIVEQPVSQPTPKPAVQPPAAGQPSPPPPQPATGQPQQT